LLQRAPRGENCFTAPRDSRLERPAPGGVLLGGGEYLGTSQPSFARDAGVTAVFAAPLSPSAILDYYQRTYPDFGFPTGTSRAEVIDISGTDGWGYVGVRIQTTAPVLNVGTRPGRAPDVSADYNITLKPAPPGSTYVIVDVLGQTGRSRFLDDPK
jgi:hypothetical protein